MNILPVKLPWLHLADKFVVVTKKGDVVTYLPLTEKLEAMFGESEGSSQRENLFRNRDALVKLFRLLDADQSGSLDRAEFAKGCEMIDIDGFMDALDVNGDGAISFAEFSDGLLNHGSMAAHSGAEIGVHSPAKPVGEAAEPAAVEPE